MTAESLLAWFSGTKLVTAVAIAILRERRLLDLDTPIASILPPFGAHGKDAITLRHVLTHTGGFRRPAETDEIFVGAVPPDELLRRIYDAPLEWEPGERAGYHPVTGFDLLGEVVRAVDGRSFDDFAAEEIFERLEMADSWMALAPERVRGYGDRIAVMYDTSDPGRPRPLPRFLRDDGFTWIAASGSALGPMHDLVRLAEALRRGGELNGERILTAASVDEMRSAHRVGMRDETFGAVMDWGLGVMRNSMQYTGSPAPYGFGAHAGAEAFGHGGRQSSVVFADPDNALSVAFGCNGMPGEAANHRRTQPVLTALYEDLGAL